MSSQTFELDESGVNAPEPYNPIVRTFGQVRAALVGKAGLARHEIRPGTPLATALPVPIRREVWRSLQAGGLRLPGLELSERDRGRTLWSVLQAAPALAIGSWRWSALPLTIHLALAVYWAGRRRAVEFPVGLKTVGELVICATCFSDHRASGYRWTRNEIALKVRLIVAQAAGLPLDAVQPERTWAELGMD